MESITSVAALEKAINIAGGQGQFAKKLSSHRKGLEISPAQVWNWVNRDKGAPAAYCPDIEELFGVKCEDLHPSVNWAALRKRPRKTATKAVA